MKYLIKSNAYTYFGIITHTYIHISINEAVLSRHSTAIILNNTEWKQNCEIFFQEFIAGKTIAMCSYVVVIKILTQKLIL